MLADGERAAVITCKDAAGRVKNFAIAVPA
jgi:hypothetical protein